MEQLPARSIALLTSCLCAFAFGMTTPATARVWVSVNGNDADPKCGAATEPCRSFQHAHDISPAGGEIDVAVPGGYGALTITKALTINAGAAGSAIIQASSATPNGIVINASPGDAIYLNGLWIDGAQNIGSGIVFNSGSALTVTNCTVRHFAANGYTVSGDGILVAPAAGPVSLTVTNSVLSDNGNVGLLVFPSGIPNITGSIDKLTASNNRFGIYLFTSQTGGGEDDFTISNSVLNNSKVYGLYATSGSDYLNARIINNNIVSNDNGGIYNQITRGSFVSYGGNILNNNGVNGNIAGSGTLLTAATQ